MPEQVFSFNAKNPSVVNTRPSISGVFLWPEKQQENMVCPLFALVATHEMAPFMKS